MRRAVLEQRGLVKLRAGVLQTGDHTVDEVAIGCQRFSEVGRAGLKVIHGKIGERATRIRSNKIAQRRLPFGGFCCL